MSIVIELSPETEARVRAYALAEGRDVAAVVAHALEDAFGSEQAEAEIAEALAEFEASYADGERGQSVAEVRSALDAVFAARARRHRAA